ncbi:hypothetical protein BD289DRAFT_106643 [Coniella lustricola]|uniref:Uncharacterized protein n=1 Tax=Coniella lustricola TaxID=2025994 RepID=A0A2T2ZXP8_9PEZI|nr:hypothetical protein BD289DRAFT_106643 [Coniella lustricola]
MVSKIQAVGSLALLFPAPQQPQVGRNQLVFVWLIYGVISMLWRVWMSGDAQDWRLYAHAHLHGASMLATTSLAMPLTTVLARGIGMVNHHQSAYTPPHTPFLTSNQQRTNGSHQLVLSTYIRGRVLLLAYMSSCTRLRSLSTRPPPPPPRDGTGVAFQLLCHMVHGHPPPTATEQPA